MRKYPCDHTKLQPKRREDLDHVLFLNAVVFTYACWALLRFAYSLSDHYQNWLVNLTRCDELISGIEWSAMKTSIISSHPPPSPMKYYGQMRYDCDFRVSCLLCKGPSCWLSSLILGVCIASTKQSSLVRAHRSRKLTTRTGLFYWWHT